VPGEHRLIGHGIAFCATCDAPLYRDKRVAVAGGGNSAFTAARDMLHYAREIHIINIMEDFQADPILMDEVKQAPHVKLHPAMQVVAMLYLWFV
jgi:alkyl hydroperoxide reductase subunit F